MNELEMKEVQALADEIVGKVLKKVEGELSSKFITMDELKATLEASKKELVANVEAKSNGEFANIVLKAMTEGTGADGGYLVPPTYVNQILDIAKAESVALQKATVINVGTNIAYVPYVNTEVGFTWTTEGNAPASTTQPAFGQLNIPIKKALAITEISAELLADQQVGPAVDTLLVTLFGRAFAKEVDRLVLTGKTTSGDPFNGVLNTSGLTTVVASSTDGPDYTSLVQVPFAISDYYSVDPMWFFHRQFVPMVLGLTTPSTTPVMNPTDKTLLGYNYARIESMPAPTNGAYSAGATMALFGDLSKVVLALRQQLTIQSSTHLKFDQDLVVVKAAFRLGFAVSYPASFVAYKTKAS